MATILLVFIYIFYIGLGIPDSLLGAAWPAIYGDLSIPISYASLVSVIISCGTVLSSLFSAHVIAKLGTPCVTVLSTSLTAIALLGFSFSQNFLWLCICAIPLGIGAGSIDTALNNYVVTILCKLIFSIVFTEWGLLSALIWCPLHYQTIWIGEVAIKQSFSSSSLLRLYL